MDIVENRNGFTAVSNELELDIAGPTKEDQAFYVYMANMEKSLCIRMTPADFNDFVNQCQRTRDLTS
jgi:hypothetical protein